MMVVWVLAFVVLGAQDSPWGTRIEGIAAVVGSELILKSEVDAVLALELAQRRIPPQDTSVARLRREVLESLIEDKLLVHYARQETIKVEGEELEEALGDRLQRIRAQFPSESAFLAQLEEEGMDMAQFRLLQRRLVEEQLVKAKLQERLRDRWRIRVTEAEVRRFCEERADEIPESPERVELSHILLRPGPPQDLRASEDSLLRSLRARILAGESFEDLAKQYSQDASASVGGDLGLVQWGSVVPEFEEAVRRLSPGQLSDVVETRFGLHLILLTQKDQRAFRARHLVRLWPSGGQGTSLEPLIQEILDKSATTPFAELARQYSVDHATRERGGSLGVVVPSVLEEGPLRALLDTLPEGVISPPLTDAAGTHLYLITKRHPRGKPPCQEVAAGIRELLFTEKLQSKLQEFLGELRAQTYVEVFE